MPPIFNTSCENPKMHIWSKFGDYSSDPLKVIARTSRNFYNSESKLPKWPWRSRSMTSISIPDERVRECMFGANSVILAQIYGDISCGQGKFPRILSQIGKNDLEGHSQWPFSIPAVSVSWCMFSANLVIPARIFDELSWRQDTVYGQTDSRTDRRTDITTVPLRPNERAMGWHLLEFCYSSAVLF